jgi:hypothetical protein
VRFQKQIVGYTALLFTESSVKFLHGMTIYLFIVLRFQTSYNNCIKEAGTPQQLNTNYSGPFTKYQYKYKYRKQK